MKTTRKRRTLTSEQQAKSEERKARFRAFLKHIADLSDAQRAELAGNSQIMTVEGHPLSFKNQMLIALQLPTATIVGGFRQWLAQGRCVRKGQHGAAIWVPTSKGNKAEAQPTPGGETGGENAERTHFIMGTVFDISQTEQTAVGSGDADESEDRARTSPTLADTQSERDAIIDANLTNQRGELLLEMGAN